MKHHLGDKTIADVCEALIGAALLSSENTGDMDMAVKAVTALVSNEDHNVTKWADYYPLYTKPKYQLAQATASQLDLAMQIEKVHDYHFKYPRLLRSAFIHPSYTFAAEKIPCYQRLEFLGDALLDMTSISFLFHRHPDKDPQWLTEHKVRFKVHWNLEHVPCTNESADGHGFQQVFGSIVCETRFSQAYEVQWRRYRATKPRLRDRDSGGREGS